MTPSVDPDTGLPLADFLKAKTWSLHTEAEKTGVVSDIVHQRVLLNDYLNYIQNLREIYETLESETRWLGHYDEVGEFFTSSLFRSTHLKHDYENLRSRQPPMPSTGLHPVTRSYCEHILQAQKQRPAAMLAHIYVRYLGDLNGGLIMQRLLKSSLNLTEDCLTFYAFPDIEDIAEFRSNFRDTLNRVVLTEVERHAVSKAAMETFSFNIVLSAKCRSKISYN